MVPAIFLLDHGMGKDCGGVEKSFIHHQVGFLLREGCGGAWVLTTTNGGGSWSSCTLPLPPGSADDSVFEGLQANQGVDSAWLWLILADNHHPNQQQWFLDRTTDGGIHWIRIPWTQAIPNRAR